jgi:hypothetical protein
MACLLFSADAVGLTLKSQDNARVFPDDGRHASLQPLQIGQRATIQKHNIHADFQDFSV